MNHKRYLPTSNRQHRISSVLVSTNSTRSKSTTGTSYNDESTINTSSTKKKQSIYLCVGWIILILLGLIFVLLFLFIQIIWIVTVTTSNESSSNDNNNNNNNNNIYEKNTFYSNNNNNINEGMYTRRMEGSKKSDRRVQRRQRLDEQTKDWIATKMNTTSGGGTSDDDNDSSTTISYFNGIPVIYTTVQRNNVQSHVHCVGNTYQDMFFNNNNNNKKDTTNSDSDNENNNTNDDNHVHHHNSKYSMTTNTFTTVEDDQRQQQRRRLLSTTTESKDKLKLQRRKRKNEYNTYNSIDESWKYRSCYYTGLFCFNMSSNDYVVYQSYHESIFQKKYLQYRPYFDSSTSTILSSSSNNNNITNDKIKLDKIRTNGKRTKLYTDTISVSIGGINKKWNTDTDTIRLRWSPKVIRYDGTSIITDDETTTVSYYELPPHIVLVPYHSLNGANPGHLVWDDFLPIYTLLEMFRLVVNDNIDDDDDNDEYNFSTKAVHELLPMRYVLPTTNESSNNDSSSSSSSRGLWASCDWNQMKTESCKKMITKFQSLLVGNNYPYNWTTTKTFEFHHGNNNRNNGDGNDFANRKSDLICSKHGLAGIGALTDHGTSKLHGWEPNDYKTVHNSGRGKQLYDFRNFMINNVNTIFGTDTDTDINEKKASSTRGGGSSHGHRLLQRPYRVVLSQHSSDVGVRDISFDKQIQAIQTKFSSDYVQVFNYTFKDLSISEQVSIVSNCTIYISLCGGGAVSGIFVPTDASILLYYYDGMPALLDYDLFNSLTYARVHWLPLSTIDTKRDIHTLIALIQHEIEYIEFLNTNQ